MAIRLAERSGTVAGDRDPSPSVADWLDACVDNEFVKAKAEADQFTLLGQLVRLAQPVSSEDPTTVWFSDVDAGEELDAVLYVAPVPSIQQHVIVEYAARTGRSLSWAKAIVLDALLVRQRLPKMWQMIAELRLPVHRARQISQGCVKGRLPLEGWAWIDRSVAAFTRRLGPVIADKLVAEAFRLFAAEEEPDQGRGFVAFDHRPAGGVRAHTKVHARLDPADALAFEQALKTVAQDLREAGDLDPLEARMARAVGVIGQAVIDRDSLPPAPSASRTGPVPRASRARQVQLFAHVNADTFTGGERADSHVVVNNHHLIDADLVKRWCGHPDAAVTVTPVIDLAEPVSSASYPPTFSQRARTALAHQHCMFPNCDRAASPVVIHIDEDGGVMANCDADHIVPYRPGQVTSTEDLAPLCRTHHRMKTLRGWTYTKVFDRTYLWTSPFKTAFLVTPDATIELPVPARAERVAQQMWAIVHPERLGLKEPDPEQYPGVAEWDGRLPDDPAGHT